MLPIPELVPFRLTRQMRGVLQPHDARAVLRTPCVLGMTALRAGATVLEVSFPLTTSHTSNTETLQISAERYSLEHSSLMQHDRWSTRVSMLGISWSGTLTLYNTGYLLPAGHPRGVPARAAARLAARGAPAEGCQRWEQPGGRRSRRRAHRCQGRALFCHFSGAKTIEHAQAPFSINCLRHHLFKQTTL